MYVTFMMNELLLTLNDQLKGQVGIKCGYSLVRGLTGVVPRVSISGI